MSNLFNNTTDLQEILDLVNFLPDIEAIPDYGIFNEQFELLSDWNAFVNETGLDIERDYTTTYNMLEEPTALNPMLQFFMQQSAFNIRVAPGISRIGNNACFGTKSLYSMSVPDTVLVIGESAFEYSGLVTITIPRECTKIEKNAFRHTNLQKIYFKGTIEEWENINKHPYWNYGIKCLIVCSDGMTTLEESNYSEDLSYVSQDNGTCYVSGKGWHIGREIVPPPENPDTGEKVLRIQMDSFIENPYITTLKVPTTVERIGTMAFQKCVSLDRINIPEGGIFQEIGQKAFGGCSALSSIRLPFTTNSIGEEAFNNCSNLKSLTIFAAVPPTLKSNSLNNTNKDLKIYVPGGYLSTYRKATNWSAYAEQMEIIPPAEGLNITLNEQNTYTIVNKGTASYADLVLPNAIDKVQVNFISAYAFIGDEKIKYVWIGPNMQAIGTSAFANCPNVESIIVGPGIQTIDAYAFANCPKLRSFTIRATNPPSIDSTALQNLSANCIIRVPTKSVDAYKTATGWSVYADQIQAIVGGVE